MLMLTRLAPLLASVAALDVAQFLGRLRRNALMYALVLLFSLTAYFALVAAGAVLMAERMGAVGALLVVAGAAVFLALAILLVMRLAARAEEKRKQEAVASGGGRALMATAALSVLPIVMKSRSLGILAVAGGLGFLAMKNMDSIAAMLHRQPSPPPRDPRDGRGY